MKILNYKAKRFSEKTNTVSAMRSIRNKSSEVFSDAKIYPQTKLRGSQNLMEEKLGKAKRYSKFERTGKESEFRDHFKLSRRN